MAIIGAILGDIAGSRWEFGRPEDLDWKHIDLFTDECFYTDDTVLTVATKYKILNHISFADAYHKFGNDYPNCSYGGGFHTWLNFDDKKPYNSFGNGSAMRVSPVADFAPNWETATLLASQSADCTHNHPEGIKGAIVTSACCWLAKNGASKNDIEKWASERYPAEQYRFPVSMSLRELREKYRWDVTCQGSVPVAIRCFLDSEDYESFIRNVLSLTCDTDTLCAIGGGIAEEFYHSTGLDEEYLLKKYLDDNLYKIVRMSFGE